MAIRYPSGLPCPLRDNYGFTPTNNIQRTEMQSGRARQRITFRNTPSMLSLSWICSPVQALLFESWCVQVAGAEWFEIPLLTPQGYETVDVRFTETPGGGELVGVQSWRYTAVLELRNRPLIPPGFVEFPEYVLEQEILDRAINHIWPLNPWQRYADAADEAINEDWPKS